MHSLFFSSNFLLQDAIYIETGGSHSYKKARNELVEVLENVKEGIDDKMHKTALKVVTNSQVAIPHNESESEMDDDGERF